MTDFTTKCSILGDFYSDYKHEKDFEDFMEFNDLGLPLAYFVAQSLCQPSDDGVKFINDTWDLFLASLELTDTGFSNLEEVFQASESDVLKGRLQMSIRLESFLQYFRMFVTGLNLRDMVNNLDNHDLLCGTNKELFTAIQEYLYDFYSDFHGEVWDEIDMTMDEMKVPDSLREKFEMWYSELYVEDDFEFIQSCFLSVNPEEFFGYGILSQIGDSDFGIDGWDPEETASLKSLLEHWICSKRRKDFLEKIADEHIDTLIGLSERY